MTVITINDIWERYREDLDLTEEKIRETFESVAPAIATVGKHLHSSGGKRFRPFLSILSAKMLGLSGHPVATLACSVECIHTASLLHDDVIDGADVRRGQPAANAVYGNQIVILVGDYFYANALRLANLLKNHSVMDAICTATAKMSEGELLQLSKKGNPETSEEDYMKVVEGKTATLISAACRGGAALAGADEKQEKAFQNFGLKLGYAFQMVDDILDYSAAQKELGKTLGKDLEEGKITLPLIYLLRDASPAEKERAIQIIKSGDFGEGNLATILQMFDKYGSIKKSYDRAHTLLQEAKDELSIFEDSPERASLYAIADYAVSRKK
ncbi:MAG: polyprenyl synthetase family protein [Nitrospira sp.]|nr:polyprenyl synthetase family protein [Nitrospira sp.]